MRLSLDAVLLLLSIVGAWTVMLTLRLREVMRDLDQIKRKMRMQR